MVTTFTAHFDEPLSEVHRQAAAAVARAERQSQLLGKKAQQQQPSSPSAAVGDAPGPAQASVSTRALPRCCSFKGPSCLIHEHNEESPGSSSQDLRTPVGNDAAVAAGEGVHGDVVAIPLRSPFPAAANPFAAAMAELPPFSAASIATSEGSGEKGGSWEGQLGWESVAPHVPVTAGPGGNPFAAAMADLPPFSPTVQLQESRGSDFSEDQGALFTATAFGPAAGQQAAAGAAAGRGDLHRVPLVDEASTSSGSSRASRGTASPSTTSPSSSTDTVAGKGKGLQAGGRPGNYEEHAGDGGYTRGPFEAALVMHKDGFVPLSKHLSLVEAGAHELHEQLEQKQQQREGQGVAGHLSTAPQQQEGQVGAVFSKRCEWELDPRKVLVGRRLAVGGFAEVFLGKYEVRVLEQDLLALQLCCAAVQASCDTFQQNLP